MHLFSQLVNSFKASLRHYESMLSMIETRSQLKVLEPFVSPYDLIDRMAEQTIAQQLTLLDFQYFKAIEVSYEIFNTTLLTHLKAH